MIDKDYLKLYRRRELRNRNAAILALVGFIVALVVIGAIQ